MSSIIYPFQIINIQRFMKERLKQIRLKLGYNQQEMANILGIELNTYRGYEYKTKNFPDILLKALLTKLQVNINWLLSGFGEMFLMGENKQYELNLTFTKEEAIKIKEMLLTMNRSN